MSVSIGIDYTPSSASITVDEILTISYDAGMAGQLQITDTAFAGTATILEHTPETTTNPGVLVIVGQALGSVTITPQFEDSSGISHETDGSFQLTVTAATEDHEFLNKRGLRHFWRKIKTALAGKADSSSLSAVATSGSYNDLVDAPNYTRIIQVPSLPSSGIDNNAIYVVVPTS